VSYWSHSYIGPESQLAHERRRSCSPSLHLHQWLRSIPMMTLPIFPFPCARINHPDAKPAGSTGIGTAWLSPEAGDNLLTTYWTSKKQLLKWLVTRPCSLRNLRSVMLENDSWAGMLLSLCTISELVRMVCFWTRGVPTCAHSPHCQSSCCCRATIILYFTKPWSFQWWT